MIGRKQLAVCSEQLAVEEESQRAHPPLPTAHCKRPTASRGFTLLELMIVISIIIILAVIAMPQYQKTVLHAKETVLRDDLFQFRKVIDMYAADKGKLPQSLQDLVDAGYMREVPIDPMTDRNDTWQPVIGEDTSSAEGGQGITDLHSGSPDVSSEGTPYNEW